MNELTVSLSRVVVQVSPMPYCMVGMFVKAKPRLAYPFGGYDRVKCTLKH